MTVNTTDITDGPYAGNDIVDEFAYNFRADAKENVTVFETDDLGVQTILVVDVDYTVNDVGVDVGGTILRIAAPLPTNFTWFIRSNYTDTQLTNFRSQGAFFPGIHEDAFDKATFLIQQLTDLNARALKFSVTYSGTLNPTLPAPEAGKFLQWNPAETGFINQSTTVNFGTPDPIGDVTPNTGDFTALTATSFALAGNMTVTGTVDGRDIATDGTKLDSLVIGTTVQAWTQILEDTTEAFLVADGTKLDGIETAADVTGEANVIAALDGATIPTATVSGTDKIMGLDASDSDNLKTYTAQDIADLAAAGSSQVSDNTLDGTLAAGDVVLLKTDGDVVPVINTLASTATLGGVSGDATGIGSIGTVDPSTGNVIVFTSGSVGKYQVGIRQSDGSFDMKTQGDLDTAGVATLLSATTNEAGKVYALWHDASDGMYLKGGSIDPVTGVITFGTRKKVPQSQSTNGGGTMFYDLGTDRIIMGFYAINDWVSGCVATTSGNEVTFGIAYNFSTDKMQVGFGKNDICKDEISGNYLFTWVKDTGTHLFAVVLDNTGTTVLASGTVVDIHAFANSEQPRCHYHESMSKPVVTFADGNNSNRQSARVMTITGTAVVPEAVQQLSTNNGTQPHVGYNSQFDVAHYTYILSSILYIANLSASGETLTLGTPTAIDVATSDLYTVNVKHPSSGNVIVGTNQGSKGNFYSMLVNSTNLSTLPFLGFSTAAYTDTQLARTNVLGGINSQQTGLTPGLDYFIDDDGNLALVGQTETILAGRANQSTSILVGLRA